MKSPDLTEIPKQLVRYVVLQIIQMLLKMFTKYFKEENDLLERRGESKWALTTKEL